MEVSVILAFNVRVNRVLGKRVDSDTGVLRIVVSWLGTLKTTAVASVKLTAKPTPTAAKANNVKSR